MFTNPTRSGSSSSGQLVAATSWAGRFLRLPLLLSCALAVSCLSGGDDAGPPIATWARSYGPGLAAAKFVEPTPDGGYVAVGATAPPRSPYESSLDAWIAKLDAAGRIAWFRMFDLEHLDVLSAVRVIPDGGFVAAGTTFSESFVSAAWVLRLDASGNLLWQKSLSMSRVDDAWDVRPTTDGGFLVAGRMAENFDFAGWLVKLDARGNVVWARAYPGIVDRILPTADGGYVGAGMKNVAVDTAVVWVFKLGPGGDIQWQRNMAGTPTSDFRDLKPTIDGGYVVLTETHTGWGGATLLKLSAGGDVVWQKLYTAPPTHVYPASVQPSPDGGYVVAIRLEMPGRGFVMLLMKVGADGEIAWQKTYDRGQSMSYPTSIRTAADGGYVVAGQTHLPGDAESIRALVLKLDAEGAIAGCAMTGVSILNANDSQTVVTAGTETSRTINVSSREPTATVSGMLPGEQDQCGLPGHLSRLPAQGHLAVLAGPAGRLSGE